MIQKIVVVSLLAVVPTSNFAQRIIVGLFVSVQRQSASSKAANIRFLLDVILPLLWTLKNCLWCYNWYSKNCFDCWNLFSRWGFAVVNYHRTFSSPSILVVLIVSIFYHLNLLKTLNSLIFFYHLLAVFNFLPIIIFTLTIKSVVIRAGNNFYLLI